MSNYLRMILDDLNNIDAMKWIQSQPRVQNLNTDPRTQSYSTRATPLYQAPPMQFQVQQTPQGQAVAAQSYGGGPDKMRLPEWTIPVQGQGAAPAAPPAANMPAQPAEDEAAPAILDNAGQPVMEPSHQVSPRFENATNGHMKTIQPEPAPFAPLIIHVHDPEALKKLLEKGAKK